jgi:hypothetical protein
MPSTAREKSMPATMYIAERVHMKRATPERKQIAFKKKMPIKNDFIRLLRISSVDMAAVRQDAAIKKGVNPSTIFNTAMPEIFLQV